MSEPVIEAAAEVAPEAVEVAPEPVAVEPTAPWGPSPEEWQNLTSSVAQLTQQFQPVEPQPDYFPIDPVSGETSLTMEGLERFVQDKINAGVEAKLGAYEPVLNQTVAERGEALINQSFDTLAKPADQGGAGLGDFDRALARELAEGYASSGFAPDDAIKRGAQRARDFAAAERKAGADEYRTTIGNISKAPRELGVNGAGIPAEEVLPVGHPDRYKQIADNWAARQRHS